MTVNCDHWPNPHAASAPLQDIAGSSILILLYGALESLPPVTNVAVGLRMAGYPVILAASTIGPSSRAHLNTFGVVVCELDANSAQLAHGPAKWWRFTRAAWRLLGKVPVTSPVWVGSTETALALGPALARRKYILHMHELHDRIWRYRLGIGPLVRRAESVVVPEASRAGIIRYWYGLQRTPFVVPNKPVGHRFVRRAQVSSCSANQALGDNGEARIILYQGTIHPNRDIRPVAKAVRALGAPWKLVLLGRAEKQFLSNIRDLCPTTVYIPHLPAPDHLQVTSHAHIGILAYEPTSLNNLFCAPNKLWEYCGFGIPVLCNDAPGLEPLLRVHRAGLALAFENHEAIAQGLLTIDRNYPNFRACAQELFDSVDIPKLLDGVMTNSFLL